MTRQTPRARNPEATRRKILEAAFEEIHLKGFQAARVDAVLDAAGVTKGAFYHHFDSKAELGLAVLDEVIRAIMLEDWVEPLSNLVSDPITALQNVVRAKAASFTDQGALLGCPLNNLAQEMSPIDPRFRERIDATFTDWEAAFARALEGGQRAGTVRDDIDPGAVSAFMVAAAEGTFGRAKSAGGLDLIHTNLELLVAYLENLRPIADPGLHP